jgi:hypothetical protein
MKPTGHAVLERALLDVTDPPKRYVYGAFVPKNYSNWPGPFDCAEALSYWHYQAAGILFGTTTHDNPATADAWSRAWLNDAVRLGGLVSVERAARTPGASILRIGIGATGHVVLSDGKGGTVEAHSTARGVIAGSLSDRRWTHGVLVPGINYETGPVVPLVTPTVYRLTSPYMTGGAIREVQERLQVLGYALGRADGVYGPRTYAAVLEFQRDKGLMVDGEVGQITLAALRER